METQSRVRVESVPREACERLQEIARPHIDSFNFFCEEGLQSAVQGLEVVEVVERVRPTDRDSAIKHVMKVSLQNVRLAKPECYPWECRERNETYRGALIGEVVTQIDDETPVVQNKKLGNIPIMIKSRACRLQHATPREMVKHHEDANEFGGYFIQNGIERCIRLLVISRRNHALAVTRASFANRGPKFSEHGVMVRCVRPDQSGTNNVMHYLTTGEVVMSVNVARQPFFLPVMMLLKACKQTSDREIFDHILQGDDENTYVSDRIEALLNDFEERYSLHSQLECLEYLGSRFRTRIQNCPVHATDEELGEHILRNHVLVHAVNSGDKFSFLIHMLQKLYSLVKGDIQGDSPDSPINQEVLQGGHVFLILLKERLQDYLGLFRIVAEKEMKKNSWTNLRDANMQRKIMDSATSDVGKKMEYFLATGNLNLSRMSVGQTAGFTIVAEKLNFFRFISHFRSIHRGQVFTTMRTTNVRKLLPDAWGFICPVHTPDGAPCGLLNHLTSSCKIVNTMSTAEQDECLHMLLADLGVIPAGCGVVPPKRSCVVVHNGIVVGHLAFELMKPVADRLRHIKVTQQENVSPFLEVGCIPPSIYGPFPGLYLFTDVSRMMRPVEYMATNQNELIGTLEQPYMDIACMDEDIKPGTTTHREWSPYNVLSIVANLTPFSDFNQSPRNMYQCQMAKQTMGTPCHNISYRVDNKMYRIVNVQSPIVRTEFYDAYEVDQYPAGVNAVVAVISHTGYDMEDAMIINKSSMDRGLGHGIVYVTETVSLQDEKKAEASALVFSNLRRHSSQYRQRMRLNAAAGLLDGSSDENEKVVATLESDGLPSVGTLLSQGDPFYCILDQLTGEHRVVKFKKSEPHRVQDVKLIGTDGSPKAVIKLRIERNPVIGDKFSSRHGQKGTLSLLWPAENMPFTESGMTPDIIINPHAFPSRMTIGMLIESSAAKAGALHGLYQNGSAFRFNEKDRAVDFFGHQLLKAGYNYYGNETMYSGALGTEMQAEIFTGVVYYQRLRHMVKDKFQVRSTGPVDPLTKQPVQGRKKGGGIRFGEMERDSLLAHGVSFFLHDRLFRSSDQSNCFACRRCGSILSVQTDRTSLQSGYPHRVIFCRTCSSSSDVVEVCVPYVFRYLVNELAAMNIRLNLDIARL